MSKKKTEKADYEVKVKGGESVLQVIAEEEKRRVDSLEARVAMERSQGLVKIAEWRTRTVDNIKLADWIREYGHWLNALQIAVENADRANNYSEKAENGATDPLTINWKQARDFAALCEREYSPSIMHKSKAWIRSVVSQQIMHYDFLTNKKAVHFETALTAF